MLSFSDRVPGVKPSGPRLTSKRKTASRDSWASALSALITSADFMFLYLSNSRSQVKSFVMSKEVVADRGYASATPCRVGLARCDGHAHYNKDSYCQYCPETQGSLPLPTVPH